jgi:hypothetical protein
VSAVAGAGWVQWVFAAMFAALTLVFVARLITVGRDTSAGGGAEWSVDLARGVMSLGMVAMLIPWVDPLPPPSWQVLFGLSAGHIAFRLIRRNVRCAPAPVPGAGRDEHHELHLVIGGLAMVYMLTAMPARPAMAEHAEGMDMAAMGSTGSALPVLTWALVAYFLVFVVRLGARLATGAPTLASTPADAALRGGPRSVVASPHLLGSCEVVMGIGMSYMLMTML